MNLYDRIPDKWIPSDSKRSNRQRCSIIAKRALKAATNEENEPHTTIADLLADLRHLCDHLRLDFADIDQQAYDHYIEEVGEDRRR